MPAPTTATVEPATSPARSTAWTATAAGSTITASSSLIASGTGCSWERWATKRVDQPPPVDAQ